MPVWATIVLVVVASVLLVAGTGVGAWFGWRAFTRRLLLRLVVRAEAVEAAGQALVDTVSRLAHGEDEALAEFADDPDSSERRAMHEVTTRAHILANELDTMALPRSLVLTAESLGDAAVVVEREASRVHDGHTGHAALDALSEIDLQKVRTYTRAARERLTDACLTHGLDDTAVYGGGLYL